MPVIALSTQHAGTIRLLQGFRIDNDVPEYGFLIRSSMWEIFGMRIESGIVKGGLA